MITDNLTFFSQSQYQNQNLASKPIIFICDVFPQGLKDDVTQWQNAERDWQRLTLQMIPDNMQMSSCHLLTNICEPTCQLREIPHGGGHWATRQCWVGQWNQFIYILTTKCWQSENVANYIQFCWLELSLNNKWKHTTERAECWQQTSEKTPPLDWTRSREEGSQLVIMSYSITAPNNTTA